MNRTGLVVCLAGFMLSGVVFAVTAVRVGTNWRDSRSGAVGRGSESVVDADYQKMPADGQSDWMEDFTLTERSGQTVRWSELAGKVRVASFFFSSCPANCLQQNLKIRDIERAYVGKDVVCVSISCDPDIDSPERLREYATRLEASRDQWLFLTGPLKYIRRVATEMFNVALDKQTHSERLFVCDKWGNIRGGFLWNRLDEMAQLRLLVDKLLDETEPPAEFRPDAS